MSLLLAPYNNAMRLGQGFNSYTQQICIDDAVIVDKDRDLNIVNNAGDTMLDVIHHSPDDTSSPSHEQGQQQSPESIRAESEHSEDAVKVDKPIKAHEIAVEEPEKGEAGPSHAKAPGDKQAINDEEKAKLKKEEREKAAADAANIKAFTKEDLEKKKSGLNLAERPTGMSTNDKIYSWSLSQAKGPSQVVTYSSRFVDKLSDVTDDMNISGSLSIKYGQIGGSGRGAFVNSDKFKQSDLNFYISVKVINQTINWKDALAFNGLDPNMSRDAFNKLFGDSFISGFLEGGEFNALVSMRILNKAKLTDIEAEAKVALTVGPGVDIKAEAHVNVAKKNIETNTETTIQVSWSGGGHIKDPREQWTLDSLTRAAARFPDLVAQSPQRTYAILSKYDTLRSFAELKPKEVSPLAYDHAQLYTSTMMDTYMEYKAMHKKIGADMFACREGGTKKIKGWDSGTTIATDPMQDSGNFEASLKGFDDGRKGIRKQMMVIVQEVDDITRDPSKLTADRKEPFSPPATFAARLPIAEDIVKPPQVPLSGEAIAAPPSADRTKHLELLLDGVDLANDESEKIEALKKQRPDIGDHLRLAPLYGGKSKGQTFNNLDFVQQDFVLASLTFDIANGAISGFTTRYTNGLMVSTGKVTGQSSIQLSQFAPGERIIAGAIETGKGADDSVDRVLALSLFTNRGRKLTAQAKDSTFTGGVHIRDGVEYKSVTMTSLDSPMQNGSLRGFWGRSDDRGIIWRLGLIWGDAISDIDQDGTGTQSAATGPSIYAQSGRFDVGYPQDGQKSIEKRVQINFPQRYSSTPRVITGMCHFDIEPTLRTHYNEISENFGPTGFQQYLAVDSSPKFNWNLGAAWCALPENDVLLQTGQVSLDGIQCGPPANFASLKVMFSKKYKSKPKVACWLKGIKLGEEANLNCVRRAKCYIKDTTAEYCIIMVETWGDSKLEGGNVGWLAWDSEADGKSVRTFDLWRAQEKDQNRKEVGFASNPLNRDPVVFAALREFSFGSNVQTRLSVKVVEAKRDKIVVDMGPWEPDSTQACGGTGVTVIVFDG